MEEEPGSGQAAAHRRLAIAVVTVAVLGVAGRIAVFWWTQWMAIPFLIAVVAVVAVVAVLEAQVQGKKVSELVAIAVRRMIKRGR